MNEDFHCDNAQRFKEQLDSFYWMSCDYSPLHAAAASGNLEALDTAIRYCKEHGYSISQHFEWLEHGGHVGATGSALTEALLNGNLSGAERLVDEGANIDTDAMQLHGIDYPEHMHESYYITPLELAFRQDKALFQKMLSSARTVETVSNDDSCLFSRAVDSLNIELLTAIHREFPLPAHECYHRGSGFRGPITNCAALNVLYASKKQREKRLAFLQQVAPMAKFLIEPDFEDGDEFQIHQLLLGINDSKLLASGDLQHMVDRREVAQTNEARQVLEEARCRGIRNITDFYWGIRLATELLYEMDLPFLEMDDPRIGMIAEAKNPSQDDTLGLYKALDSLCNSQTLDEAYDVAPVLMDACELAKKTMDELRSCGSTESDFINELRSAVIVTLDRLITPSSFQHQDIYLEGPALVNDFEFLIAITRYANH